MSTHGNKGTRRKLPAAAVAALPTIDVSLPAAMTAEEAAPAIAAVAPDALVSAVLPDVASTLPTITITHAEEDQTMDTTATIDTATDKTQAMFADANDRAKGAMEKGAKFFSEVTEFGKGNVEALVESSKIAARGLETMGQDAATYAKTSFEGATAAMRTFATVKSPTEFMKLQADYARQAFDAMVAQTSRSTEASLKLAGEVAQPISNRVAIAADKMKIAA